MTSGPSAPKDAPVKREHRLAAWRVYYGTPPRGHDVVVWAERGDNAESAPFRGVSAVAQLVANAERDVRAAIVERLQAILADYSDGASPVLVGELVIFIDELWSAGNG